MAPTGECIASNPTDSASDARQATPAEPEASLRAELLVQLLNAQAQASEQMAQLQRIGATDLLASAEGQLQMLAAVQQRLASGAVSASALRGEVAAVVASLAANTGLVQAATASHAAQTELTLREASAQARETVQNFAQAFYGDRIFDDYLTFASPDEERGYRDRETERARAIEAALAQNTPEGNRLALSLMRDQLEDAGKYGADQSPDYTRWTDELDRSERAMDGAIAARDQKVAGKDPHTPERDPLDDIPASTTIDPAIALALRDAGVMPTDPDLKGHGVNNSLAVNSNAWERS